MMNLATYSHHGQDHYGAVTDTGLIPLSPLFPNIPSLKAAIEMGVLAHLWEKAAGRTPDHDFSAITWKLPIPDPEKIICVGVNFPDRNAEYKDGTDLPPYPSLFPRFARSFTAHEQPLMRPGESQMLDYEGEIAIVIGKGGRRIPEGLAWNHIAAITLCNEGTIRDWVRHAKFNVTQGKNFDASGSMGPWLVPFLDRSQLQDIRITTHVNGELRQDDRTSRMLFPIPRQIAYISCFTTLVPGDIIVTGTPTGAGARLDPPQYLVPGDEVVVEAEGIGRLVNGVADDA